jgi:hypothetical protein
MDQLKNKSSLINLCQLLTCENSSKSCLDLVQSFSKDDWEAVNQVALQQGLNLLLYHAVRPYKVQIPVPDVMWKKFRHDYLSATGRNLKILNNMGKILNAFHEKEIPVIGLKGIYLVENIYYSIGLRTFVDLDLLVPKIKLHSTIECLENLGFQLITYFNLKDINRDIKHVPPMVNTNGLVVEIHWTILEEDEPFTIDADGLWARAIPAQIAGVDVLALGYEDLILHLCVHMAYQHHLQAGLRNLFDIYAVIKKHPDDIDWDLLVEIAKSWGAERVIWISFKLLEEILGLKLPIDIFDKLLQQQIPPEILRIAKAQCVAEGQRSINLTPDLIDLTNKRGLIAKIKLILSRIFIPKPALARIYQIPANSPKLYIYYGKRLIDLIKFYGRSAWRMLTQDPSTLAAKQDLQTSVELTNWMVKG